MMTRWRINGSPTSKQPKTGSGGKCLLLTFGLLALTAGMAFGRSGKISKDLENADPGATVDVIIQFSERPSKQDHQRVFDKGGRLKKELPVVKGAVYSIPVSALEALANNSNVAYISSDRHVEAALDLAASAVNANMAWQFGWDGTGVGIAVIDSGIVSAADLTYSNSSANNPRIVYSQNFADSSANTSDLYGHGTHVAGILAGNATNSTGQNYSASFKGIAPNALLINLRALDQNGSGTDSTVIAAIQQAINLKTQYNIRVINLSLGHPVYESYTLDPLCQAVEAAWKAGIVVVAAAGNYGRDNSMGTKGYGTIASPGNDPYVITVGAMKTNDTLYTSDDTIASYSSKGPTLVDHLVKPDLVAPGNQVISLLAPNSTLPLSYPKTLVSSSLYETIGSSGKSGDYFMLSGTSMAAPVVSGAAALLIQQHPSMTPDQVKARLMKTATKALNLFSVGTDAKTLQQFNSQSDIFTVGAGYLNIAAALINNDLVTLPALSPAVVRDPVTRKFGILRSFSIIWGDSMLWGDAALFGNIVFSRLAV